jgi:hypothetical protein
VAIYVSKFNSNTSTAESRFRPHTCTHMRVHVVGDDKIDMSNKVLLKAETSLSLWPEQINQKRVPLNEHTIG